MNTIVLTSNSLRHKYFIKKLSEDFDILDIYIQKKRNYYNEIKKSEFVKKHFKMLEKTEKDFFNDEYDFKISEVDNINNKNILDDDIYSISYPYRREKAVNKTVVKIAKEYNFKFGLTMFRGINFDLNKPSLLNRIDANDIKEFI